MKEDKENYYKILGITENIVNHMLTKGEKENEYEIKQSPNERRDRIIKEAYDTKCEETLKIYQQELRKLEESYEIQKKSIEDKYEKSIGAKRLGLKSMNNTREETVNKLKIKMENELEEFETKKTELKMNYEKRKTELMKRYEELLEIYEHAYNEIKSPVLREINDNEVSRSNIRSHRELSFETAFDFFGITEERLQGFNPVRADEFLREEYLKRMENYRRALSDSSISFTKRKKIESLQMLCKQNYELISTPEKRKKYSVYLDNKEFEEKYSKVSQFRPELIFSNDFSKYSVYSEESEDNKELSFKNNNSIKKVGKLVFKNSTGVVNSYINQYEVKRSSENGETIDYIYTDLDFDKLDIDKNTGLPINTEYYECVVNELLSDEMIKASKLNSGYIGLVEGFQDDKGKTKYRTTLQDKKLHPTEQEYLAAVMIYENDKFEIAKNTLNKSLEEEGR